MEEDSPSLEDVESRIQKIRADDKPNLEGTQAMGLVFALGISVVTCIAGGYMAGSHFAKTTGKPWVQIVGLLLGLAAAGMVGFQLLRPFMRTK